MTYFVHFPQDRSHASAAEYQHEAFGFLVSASQHLQPVNIHSSTLTAQAVCWLESKKWLKYTTEADHVLVKQ